MLRMLFYNPYKNNPSEKATLAEYAEDAYISLL